MSTENPIANSNDNKKHNYEPHCEKPVLVVFDQFRHKPGCVAAENDERLENSDIAT